MTVDKRRPRARPGQLPDFAPVPRHYNRHDGWTPERQRGFIAALADTGSVKSAAARVNMSAESAYHLRRHPDAASFRKAWEAALALGVEQLEDLAMERAIHGHQVPVYSYGKLIGSRTVYNDRLLMFLLRNRAPTRFAADGRVTARRSGIGSPIATELSRHKRKWRKEWEAEQAERAAREGEEAARRMNAKLGRMHQHWLAGMSERTREAWLAYKRIEAEENGEVFHEPELPQLRWAEDEEEQGVESD
ncbi:hypothetical protein [Novosphingobium sp. TH158]|uniref:hypothetical protein n=1 Tax=Novosphingobium sp. TH158 TaxID=2067455 RepID=UPI000C7B1314|nr:hypothetical protein [Novosphingobium sp. TH158]PLK24231.1 hypothetical protein C0V78_13215 [Novosphingobium sp. TH158]